MRAPIISSVNELHTKVNLGFSWLSVWWVPLDVTKGVRNLWKSLLSVSITRVYFMVINNIEYSFCSLMVQPKVNKQFLSKLKSMTTTLIMFYWLVEHAPNIWFGWKSLTQTVAEKNLWTRCENKKWVEWIYERQTRRRSFETFPICGNCWNKGKLWIFFAFIKCGVHR